MPDSTPTKNDLLAALAMERRFWDAVVAAVERAGLMDRPGVDNGCATFKDVASHVNDWRGATVARFEAAARGSGRPMLPWPADLGEETPETIDNINAWFAERAKHQSLSAVLAETTAQFDALTAVITSIPASDLLTPGVFGWLGDWLVDMPIGPASLGFSFSHLHADHVPDIRAWLKRETGVDPTLPQEPPTFGFVE